MKLTDEKIEQAIEDNYAREKLLQTNCLELHRFRFGARFARDFYENQKCETCEKHMGCDIEDYMNDNEVEKPGCNQWEPKNEIIS